MSGGKDPDKRNLGPLLKLVQKGDIIISSEISRLGRDLYMVMDILHFCMERGCIIYTVKDKFVLGDDIQSKVLAFAFGLSAEIERQMIRQRTKEGLRLRMKSGVLLGRPIGKLTNVDKLKCAPHKEKIINALEMEYSQRSIAKKLHVTRETIARTLKAWEYKGYSRNFDKERIKAREKARAGNSYKDGEPYKIVELDRDKLRELIKQDLILPQIAEHFPEFTYEQIYDTVLCDEEFNPLYRQHGQLKIRKKQFIRK